MCKKYLQIQRVEEEDQVFALEISKAHLLELPVEDSSGLKIWSRLSDSRGPSGSAWYREVTQGLFLHTICDSVVKTLDISNYLTYVLSEDNT